MELLGSKKEESGLKHVCILNMCISEWNCILFSHSVGDAVKIIQGKNVSIIHESFKMLNSLSKSVNKIKKIKVKSHMNIKSKYSLPYLVMISDFVEIVESNIDETLGEKSNSLGPV